MKRIYKIPAGTKVFSIALQLNVTFDRDTYVSRMDDSEFGALQIRLENQMMQSMLKPGEDAAGYAEMAHGEVSLDYKECEFVKAYEDKFVVDLPFIKICLREYPDKIEYLIFDMGNAGDNGKPRGVKTMIGEGIKTFADAMKEVNTYLRTHNLEKVSNIPCEYADCRRKITYRKKLKE